MSYDSTAPSICTKVLSVLHFVLVRFGTSALLKYMCRNPELGQAILSSRSLGTNMCHVIQPHQVSVPRFSTSVLHFVSVRLESKIVGTSACIQISSKLMKYENKCQDYTASKNDISKN